MTSIETQPLDGAAVAAALRQARSDLARATKAVYVADRRVAEAFLASEHPRPDDLVAYSDVVRLERLVRGLEQLEIRAKAESLAARSSGYLTASKDLRASIPALSKRLEDIHHNRVPIVDAVEKNALMDATRNEWNSVEGRIARYDRENDDLQRELDALRREHSEAFLETSHLA